MKLNRLLPVVAILLLASCGDEKQTEDRATSAPVQKSKGEQLFNNYCVQCHAVKTDKIGPALKGALAKWDNDTARITKFIRNSGESIKSGDPRAMQVAKEWNNALMTPMTFLTDADVAEILDYLDK